MTVQRAAVLNRLRHQSPEDIKADLLAEGATPAEIDRLFETLPTRRVRRVHRVLRGVVLLAWLAALITQIANAILWESATVLIRDVLGALVSGLFFLAAKRLSGRSFGPGIIWLTFLILVTLSEFDTLTTEEYSDPLLMGTLWLFLGIFAGGIVGMAVLKRALFPVTPWINLRPLAGEQLHVSTRE